MRLTDIVNYFSGSISGEEFSEIIRDEVKRYKMESGRIGGSMWVELLEDNGYVCVGLPELKKLCMSFLNKELSDWQIYYMCDAILMSKHINICDNFIKEAIEEMTDPDVNGELTEIRVKDILNKIQKSKEIKGPE